MTVLGCGFNRSITAVAVLYNYVCLPKILEKDHPNWFDPP